MTGPEGPMTCPSAPEPCDIQVKLGITQLSRYLSGPEKKHLNELKYAIQPLSAGHGF